jgi:hypothetical protein
MPLLNSAYAVAAVAVPVAGCSPPTTSAPAPSQSTPPTTSRAKTSTRRTVNQSGRLPIPVHHAAGALVEGRDLVLGGGSTAVTSVVQDVTPGASSRVVSHLPQHLPHPLAHAGSFTLGDSLFVTGVRTGDTATDEVMRFDPANVGFTAAGHLPAARSDCGVAVVSGTADLVGGQNPKSVDTVIQVRAQAGGSP